MKMILSSKKVGRTKNRFGFVVVQGNPVRKSDAGWQNRQAKAKKNAFANRTDAAIRTGATRNA